jgi:hypothetical protein
MCLENDACPKAEEKQAPKGLYEVVLPREIMCLENDACPKAEEKQAPKGL